MERRVIYFKECEQDFRELPIEEENCYYLGKFNDEELSLLRGMLERDHLSYLDLRVLVNYSMLGE